jgi:F-box and leucine-rich repeat protein 2/20
MAPEPFVYKVVDHEMHSCHSGTGESQMSDITFGSIGIISSPTSHCDGRGDSTLSFWEGCKDLLSINLSDSHRITERGIPALADGCGQLRAINLGDCQGITDIGLSALVNGCRQLETINLSECDNITKIGISALGRYGQL